MAAADLAHIPDVDIDSDGVFKYVLIRVHSAPRSGAPAAESKEIVRGYKWAEYHGEGGACRRARGGAGEAGAGLGGTVAALRSADCVLLPAVPLLRLSQARVLGGKGVTRPDPPPHDSLPVPEPAPVPPSSHSSLSQSQGASSPLGKRLFRPGILDPFGREFLPRPPRAARARPEVALPSQRTSTTKCRATCRSRAVTVSVWAAGASPTRARTRRFTCTATLW